MRSDFRQRAFLPLVLPLSILGVMALIVLSIAAILLYNSKSLALVLAIAAASGILLAISLLSSDEGEAASTSKKGVVLGAALVPLVLGALTAGGVFGGITDAERNINRLPHEVIPEDAPVIMASNATDFDTDSITLPAEGEVVLVFDNEDPVSHNVAVTTLKADGTPDFGAAIFKGDIFGGPAKKAYTFASPGAGTYAFFCSVHPNMQGTIEFSADAEGGAA